MNIYDGIGGLDIILFFVRIAAGTFFAISGYHKLFNKERRAALRGTFEDDGIPLVSFCMWLVPLAEFVGGIFLVVGLSTVPTAIMLVLLLAVALVVDGVKRVTGFHPINFMDKLDDMLYLSETVYIFIMAILISAGPGMYALDNLL